MEQREQSEAGFDFSESRQRWTNVKEEDKKSMPDKLASGYEI